MRDSADEEPSDLPPRHLVGERSQRLYFFDPADVERIESEGNYVNICVDGCTYIARGTITRLAQRLESAGFVRIHRSLIVNLAKVRYAERIGAGVIAFTLESGARVLSSPRYRKRILQGVRRGRRLRETTLPEPQAPAA